MNRRKFLKSTAGLFVPVAPALLLPKQLRAQGGMMPGPGTVHSAGSSTTTFDPSNKSTHITLSGGNLIATAGSGSTSATVARSVASHSTGKFYCEITSTVDTHGSDGIGLCNSSFVIDGGTFLGGNAASGAIYSDGSVFLLNVVLAGGWIAGDVIGLAVDIGGALAWIRKNGGNWNGNASFDPATGVGGGAFVITGALFLAVEMEVSGNAFTANFGGSAYANAAPSGFGNW